MFRPDNPLAARSADPKAFRKEIACVMSFRIINHHSWETQMRHCVANHSVFVLHCLDAGPFYLGNMIIHATTDRSSWKHVPFQLCKFVVSMNFHDAKTKSIIYIENFLEFIDNRRLRSALWEGYCSIIETS